MRLDTANRAFLALLGVVIGACVVIGFVGCCVIGVVVYRVATRGTHALSAPGTVPALVLLVLLGFGAVRGSRALRRQATATGRLGRRVRRRIVLPPPVSLTEAANAVGLDDRVDLFDASEACSFTWGLVRPRVAVSRGRSWNTSVTTS